MARTGKVLLARDIKIDKGYKNVLDYSESQIVTLLNNNLVASFSNCSFLLVLLPKTIHASNEPRKAFPRPIQVEATPNFQPNCPA